MSVSRLDPAPALEADGGTRTPDPFITSDRSTSNQGYHSPPTTRETGHEEHQPDPVGQTRRPQNAPRKPPPNGWSEWCDRIAWWATEGYYLPAGGDRDDLAQEARMGIVKAIATWDESLGPFYRFARGCARAAVIDAVRAATRVKDRAANVAVSLDRPIRDENGDEGALHELVPAREIGPAGRVALIEEIREIGTAMRERLTDLECVALVGVLNGESYVHIAQELGGGATAKQVDRAITRARWKLRGQGPPSAPRYGLGGRAGTRYRCPSCGGPTFKLATRGRPPRCVVCRASAGEIHQEAA